MTERMVLKPPSTEKQLLERARMREVRPPDICSDPTTLGELFETYPDLAGDQNAIGPGDDGKCQSWRGHPGWWKSLVSAQEMRG